MSQYPGYTPDQKYRVAWRVVSTGEVSASESMTLGQARLLQANLTDDVESWLEEYNGYEWERV